jgi:hypothetical protein
VGNLSPALFYKRYEVGSALDLIEALLLAIRQAAARNDIFGFDSVEYVARDIELALVAGAIAQAFFPVFALE